MTARVPRDRGVLKGRADHHRVLGEQFSTKRAGYTYADCSFAQLQTSCSQAADYTFERNRWFRQLTHTNSRISQWTIGNQQRV